MRGHFIVFEGIDGSGKGTQLRLLEDALKNRGFDVLATREPGGTPLGEKIRELLLIKHSDRMYARTELLLMQAARAEHVDRVIKPALERGSIVLCDRFTASSMAYQGAGRGLDPYDITEMSEFATDSLEPDLTILLDLPVAEAQQRLREKDAEPDRFDLESVMFQERVRACFLKIAEIVEAAVIDASLSVGKVHLDVLQAFDARIGDELCQEKLYP